MAMVNMNNLLNGKDSRWLQLEVCREFQRQKCTRPDTECKFAHPPANVEVQNGRVTACYDSIKVRFVLFTFFLFFANIRLPAYRNSPVLFLYLLQLLRLFFFFHVTYTTVAISYPVVAASLFFFFYYSAFIL